MTTYGTLREIILGITLIQRQKKLIFYNENNKHTIKIKLIIIITIINFEIYFAKEENK